MVANAIIGSDTLLVCVSVLILGSQQKWNIAQKMKSFF